VVNSGDAIEGAHTPPTPVIGFFPRHYAGCVEDRAGWLPIARISRKTNTGTSCNKKGYGHSPEAETFPKDVLMAHQALGIHNAAAATVDAPHGIPEQRNAATEKEIHRRWE
jgi:hypothetical protein